MSELIRILGLTRNGMSSTVHMKRIESLQAIRLVTKPIILNFNILGGNSFYDLIGHVTNQILCKDSRVAGL